MLPQIVCISCGYHSAWPTLLEALADGRRHHAEHPPEPAVPESLERRCPSCLSERVVYEGRVTAGEGMTRAEHRCEACGAAFWYVRKRTKRPLSA
jgi:uncharacterized protein (DUF983 family)